MSGALQDILAERARQDTKWGEQNHDPFTYLTVLTEEVGEFAQAALHTRFGGPAADGLRIEAVHVAAVTLAIVECIDRSTWQWPEVPAQAAPPEPTSPYTLIAVEDERAAQLCDAAAARLRSGRRGSAAVEAVARAAIDAERDV